MKKTILLSLGAGLLMVGSLAHAEPMAMGKITFKYLVDDKGAMTKLEPMNHHMMMSESSPMTVEQSKAMVEKALTHKSDTETLFNAGEMFGKAKSKVKAGAKKAADMTVSIMSSDKFQKAIATAFAAGVAAAGGYAAYKSVKGGEGKEIVDDPFDESKTPNFWKNHKGDDEGDIFSKDEMDD